MHSAIPYFGRSRHYVAIICAPPGHLKKLSVLFYLDVYLRNLLTLNANFAFLSIKRKCIAKPSLYHGVTVLHGVANNTTHFKVCIELLKTLLIMFPVKYCTMFRAQ